MELVRTRPLMTLLAIFATRHYGSHTWVMSRTNMFCQHVSQYICNAHQTSDCTINISPPYCRLTQFLTKIEGFNDDKTAVVVENVPCVQ